MPLKVFRKFALGLPTFGFSDDKIGFILSHKSLSTFLNVTNQRFVSHKSKICDATNFYLLYNYYSFGISSTDIGNIGTSYPLLILISALEDAKPGDRILLASYGYGSDAIFFEVTDEIENVKGRQRGIRKMLESKRKIDSYEKYAVFKDLFDIDTGGRGEDIAFTSLSALWRDRKSVLGLVGSRCTQCGTPQFPSQKVCVNPKCGAVDKMEEYRFSDKKGRIFTYTGDNLASCLNPPAIYGMVDFDGGGRFIFDFTDCNLEELKVGMPVEMSFRRKYVDEKRGFYGYAWKAVPI